MLNASQDGACSWGRMAGALRLERPLGRRPNHFYSHPSRRAPWLPVRAGKLGVPFGRPRLLGARHLAAYAPARRAKTGRADQDDAGVNVAGGMPGVLAHLLPLLSSRMSCNSITSAPKLWAQAHMPPTPTASAIPIPAIMTVSSVMVSAPICPTCAAGPALASCAPSRPRDTTPARHHPSPGLRPNAGATDSPGLAVRLRCSAV